jgi:hypothetical protein
LANPSPEAESGAMGEVNAGRRQRLGGMRLTCGWRLWGVERVWGTKSVPIKTDAGNGAFTRMADDPKDWNRCRINVPPAHSQCWRTDGTRYIRNRSENKFGNEESDPSWPNVVLDYQLLEAVAFGWLRSGR